MKYMRKNNGNNKQKGENGKRESTLIKKKKLINLLDLKKHLIAID